MIQRYERTECGDLNCDCGGGMKPAADGDYVLYADHLENVRRLREALEHITTELEYVHAVASDDRAYTPEKRMIFASSEGERAIEQARAALRDGE